MSMSIREAFRVAYDATKHIQLPEFETLLQYLDKLEEVRKQLTNNALLEIREGKTPTIPVHNVIDFLVMMQGVLMSDAATIYRLYKETGRPANLPTPPDLGEPVKTQALSTEVVYTDMLLHKEKKSCPN